MASISMLSHMLTTSVPTSQIVKNKLGEFATSRGLTLSTEKCEVTVSPSIPPTLSSIQVGELSFLLPTQLDVSGHGGPLVSPAPSGSKLTSRKLGVHSFREAAVSSMAP